MISHSILTRFERRNAENWLLGCDRQQLHSLPIDLYNQFTQQFYSPAKVILAQAEPTRFLAAFIAAVAAKCHLFLGNPLWTQREWQQVFELVQPDLILGEGIPSFPPPSSTWRSPRAPSPLLMIPTGGSSGKIRFTIHTWQTLTASVWGFYHYFGKNAVNSFCVLPLYHVSGLMQFLRSFLTGGNFVILPFKALQITLEKEKSHPTDSLVTLKNLDLEQYFISLVPTQLQRLLSRDTTSFLSRFHTILLGGAPPWPELLDTARKYQIRLAPTYGMTETASQIVTLYPEEFLAGNNSTGQVLPHARVKILNQVGEIAKPGQPGMIAVESKSLCLGYYPDFFSAGEEFFTDDLGYFDNNGYLKIIGRRSHKIITGGENVFPNEVEAAILATQLVKDVCVIGLPDRDWGEIVTAVYVPKYCESSLEEIQNGVRDRLSKYKHPKHWIAVQELPRNQQGKMNRQAVRAIAYRKLQE